MKMLILLILTSFHISLTNANYEMKIVIDRLSFNDLCIQGNLSVDGELIGYTLELPKVGNHSNVSSIKAGEYRGTVRDDGKLGWRIELQEVESRNNIQIHVGNIRDNSRGCILVGKTANSTNCTIGGSKNIINLIKEKYYSTGNSSKEIVVIINE